MKARQNNIRDVAKRAGVSIATVSRVLNGGAGFSAATVARVREAARELAYAPARGLLVRRPGQIAVGLVVADIDLLNPFFWSVIKGIYDSSGVRGSTIYLRVYPALTETGEGIMDEMRASGMAGVLLVPGVATMPSAMAPGDLPFVLVDRRLEGVAGSAVLADNRAGAEHAARYLASLGHTRVAYVGGPPTLSTERERADGFLAALAALGLSCAPHNVLSGGFEQHVALAAMKARLAAPRDFTAVFCTNDAMAFGVKEALDAAGLLVPADVSLVGYDNVPFSSGLGLTTVGQPAWDMGRNALGLLLDLVEGREITPRQLVLSPGLIVRSSCARPGGAPAFPAGTVS